MATTKIPPINLLRGWPAPDMLPIDQLKAAATEVLSNPETSVPALQYGPDLGFQPLRKELAHWLSTIFNVTADPQRICITGGASQNLACILQSFTDPNYTRNIWMVAPCYFLACPIFEDSSFVGRLRSVPEDAEGIDVEYLKEKLEAADKEPEMALCKTQLSRKLYRHIIYLVPTSGNPSGKTLPLHRRKALVKLARAHDALIIADDVYDLLQWHNSAPTTDTTATAAITQSSNLYLPRLCDIDLAMGFSPQDPGKFGYAISNGSFSKIAGPGCRTGWVEASPAFSYGLSQTGSTRSGGAASQMSATFLYELLRTRALQEHIQQTTVPSLQRRHNIICAAIREHLYPLGVTMLEQSMPNANVYGGYFVWLTLGGEISAKAIAEQTSVLENLIIGHGDLFEVREDETTAKFSNNIRLCFSWEPEEHLVDGVKRLAKVIKTWDDGCSTVLDVESTRDWR
ncbi:Valine--pyruvate aminotransferase [Ceratocystis pirilliformis]|uniref:Valine--pyruvate aminotransferase n=1 Tax=Ceratocystis pirilliformis TaxID=259994 RepID=A0ABR3ZED3_9PEZI